jgi:transglutaminase-like putative cysteine protease
MRGTGAGLTGRHPTMHLNIDHTTVYHYHRPVRFGPHRLMIRAIEGHDVQIRSSELAVEPAGRIRWHRDVYDNSVAVVDFAEPSAQLLIRSALRVEHFNSNPFDFVLESTAMELPFRYRAEEQADVHTFLERGHATDDSRLQHWVKPFLSASGRANTLEFLTALNRSVPLSFTYFPREEPGVQTPGETLQRRTGSCRDLALLFMEAARMLGVAARYVSGYLCRTNEEEIVRGPSDTTHAWAELYLPGAGWKGFDPTCGVVAADYRVRIAVARWPTQAIPVTGSFQGTESDYAGMEVTVDAREVRADAPASSLCAANIPLSY